MNRMQDRVVVVTGAAGGMGRAHCRRLAEEGADIIAVDLPDADLAGTAREVESAGRRCVTGVADVTEQQALDAAVTAGVDRLGRLDAVVANAGVYADLALSWELPDTAWQRALDINLTGVWHTVRAGIPHLGAGGSIVVVGSTNGVRGGLSAAHYSASKHAVVGLARTVANELGAQRIRVNTVHPGSVATSMILNDTVYAALRPDLPNPTQEDAARVLAARNILPVPWVDPVDVSNAVLFLASDESRYVTGIELVVDAGLTQKV
ncbi:mycofactocin-coupled SDR family oxidoreductase [Nocardia sp. NBC_00416]|uniref:mycofactocin-coupled SDR family oxidoreductase n=1 Tax=Nocardia sp. NBC_00416 TaxID=2975991 RepID=UPI002E1A7880